MTARSPTTSPTICSPGSTNGFDHHRRGHAGVADQSRNACRLSGRSARFTQVLAEAIELLVPVLTVGFEPVIDAFERLRLKPAGPPLRLPAARDQAGCSSTFRCRETAGRLMSNGFGQSSKVSWPASRLRSARVSPNNEGELFVLARRLFRCVAFDLAARRSFFAVRRAAFRALRRLAIAPPWTPPRSSRLSLMRNSRPRPGRLSLRCRNREVGKDLVLLDARLGLVLLVDELERAFA
jgi:hypothetical protein